MPVCCISVFSTRRRPRLSINVKPERPAQDVSNCPLCAIGHDANAERIYKEPEMDADHVTAWSRGGATDLSNCQMLCVTHNRAKGNR